MGGRQTSIRFFATGFEVPIEESRGFLPQFNDLFWRLFDLLEQGYNYLKSHRNEDIGNCYANACTIFTCHIYGIGKQVSYSPWHVLVVEHNPAIREMLCRALKLAGYRVTESAGGEAWIDSVKQSDDPAALVILRSKYPTNAWRSLSA